MIPFFKLADAGYLQSLVARRPGEVKLGERIQLPGGSDLPAILQSSSARFVLFGIPEDIGVRANGGVGGAHTAWGPALKSFLNIQSTDLLPGDEVLLLGAFDFKEWMQQSETADMAGLRALVAHIDDAVFPLVQAIVASGRIPLVVGGGHNNAYPLLKGAALGRGGGVNCINLDAHSDYRVPEGRHSGNGFRYAKMGGYLERYAIVGLHQHYNSQAVLNELHAADTIQLSFYEAIFLREVMTFREAVAMAMTHTYGKPTGIELDLDCIERTLSSAATPSGITPLDARKYLHQCASGSAVAYLHLTEGAVLLRDGRVDPSTGKLIAYLLSDFIKAVQA